MMGHCGAHGDRGIVFITKRPSCCAGDLAAEDVGKVLYLWWASLVAAPAARDIVLPRGVDGVPRSLTSTWRPVPPAPIIVKRLCNYFFLSPAREGTHKTQHTAFLASCDDSRQRRESGKRNEKLPDNNLELTETFPNGLLISTNCQTSIFISS